jgi:hypothetical protein
MGLTIHYNGKFNPAASLPEMIEEVKDIAEINKWKYHIYETEFPKDSIGKESYSDNLYGIIFIPPNCEPVYLSFLSNGRMASEHGLQFWGNSQDKKEKEYLYMLSTKTQFAGREIHKWIIHLFKYLKGKYFSEFNMFDEGKYWETNDEKLLNEIFQRYENALDILGTALENIPRDRGESFEKYFERILKGINDKNKK